MPSLKGVIVTTISLFAALYIYEKVKGSLP